MKQRLLTILWLGIGLFCSSNSIFAGEAPKYIPVASYPNRPDMEPVAARAGAILRAEGIRSVAVGSAGMTISVPAERSAEALQLLAKAIKAEGLELTLIVPRSFAR